jgi:hypothetical protein
MNMSETTEDRVIAVLLVDGAGSCHLTTVPAVTVLEVVGMITKALGGASPAVEPEPTKATLLETIATLERAPAFASEAATLRVANAAQYRELAKAKVHVEGREREAQQLRATIVTMNRDTRDALRTKRAGHAAATHDAAPCHQHRCGCTPVDHSQASHPGNRRR